MFTGLLLSTFLAASPSYSHSAVTSLVISSILDLAGLAVAIWTLWTAFSLPLGGQLKRSYRAIAWGILAFAASHLLDSLIQGTQFLNSQQGLILIQTAVPASMLFFVWGLTGLGEALPDISSADPRNPLAVIWVLALSILITVGGFSVIFYGFSTEAEVVALIGLESGLFLLTGLCVVLLVRARLKGVVGRSLWLSMLGLLLFSLAHPLQIWLIEATTLSGDFLAVLHRIIVMPALILFALSMTRLAYQLNQTLLPVTPPTHAEQKTPQQKRMLVVSFRSRERHTRERLLAAQRAEKQLSQ